MSHSIQLHRVLMAPPERVYRAFTTPDALVKWLPPHGHTAKVHHMDVKVKGTYQMSFTNFSTQVGNSFSGTYLEVKENELLKYVDKFDDPNLAGEMHITIAFKKVLNGTELKITQEGIPEMIPLEFCYVGWQQSLNLLAQLVEAEIKN